MFGKIRKVAIFLIEIISFNLVSGENIIYITKFGREYRALDFTRSASFLITCSLET